MITKILEDIANAFVYIDDIVIFDKNKNEHDEISLKELKRMFTYNVKTNFVKSNISTTEIEILGCIVNMRVKSKFKVFRY